MKRIITKNQQAKKDKRNAWIIGIILIILMVFSTLGYALIGRDEQGSSTKVSYKGVEFIRGASEYWSFNVNGNNFATKYNPEETQDIFVQGYFNLNYYSKNPLYIVSDSEQAFIEIGQNIGRFVVRMQKACLDENCTDDFPIKNCSVDNIIIIKSMEESEDSGKIYKEDNCVYIEAGEEELIRHTDAFLFKVLGL